MSAPLFALRDEIDQIDAELLRILSRRFEIARRMGAIKKSAHLPIVQPDREKEVLLKRQEQGRSLDLSTEFVQAIFALLFQESKKIQEALDF